VFLAADPAGRIIVEIGDPAGQLLVAGIGPPVALAQRRDEVGAAVLADKIRQHGAIEVARVDLLEALPAALLPMTQQIAIQHAGPARAAFEEGDVEAREAAGPAPEEDSLAG